MRLDRNISETGLGKYSLINWRKQKLEMGDKPEDEFFAIKLKERFAGPALRAYAQAVREYAVTCDTDERVELVEYAFEISRLAQRAEDHPLRKTPD